jgi:hypothetical protein
MSRSPATAMTNKPTGNTNSTHQGLKLQTVPVDMSIRIETPNGLRFSGFGPHADYAGILSAWRAEVRCNRELAAHEHEGEVFGRRDGAN